MKITSQDPIHKHCYSVLIGKCSFFVNIKHDIVKINICNDMGSKRVNCLCKKTVEKLLDFVKTYNDTENIL